MSGAKIARAVRTTHVSLDRLNEFEKQATRLLNLSSYQAYRLLRYVQDVLLEIDEPKGNSKPHK